MRSALRSLLPLACGLAALAAVFAVTSLACACPTCGDAVGESDPSGEGLAKGLNYSILFMMSMPYLIFGAFGLVAYRKVKQAQAARAAEAQEPAPRV